MTCIEFLKIAKELRHHLVNDYALKGDQIIGNRTRNLDIPGFDAGLSHNVTIRIEAPSSLLGGAR